MGYCFRDYLQKMLAWNVWRQYRITQVFQHLYSPDFTPCDYAFSKAKIALERRILQILKDIKKKTTRQLNAIHFEKCKGRWDKCTSSKMEWFEEDYGMMIIDLV